MIPRDRLPRLRYADLERLAKVMDGLQANQQAIHRAKVTNSEAMVQQISDLWDLIRDVCLPARRAIANWDAAHPNLNPPEDQSGGTAPAL